MNLKSALTLTTGIGIRDYLRKHKKAAWVIIALVIANEIRGLAVVWAVVSVWFA